MDTSVQLIPDMDTNDQNKLLTLAEAADALKVSVKTVRRLVGCNELAAVRIGRQLRIRSDVLAAYIDAAPKAQPDYDL